MRLFKTSLFLKNGESFDNKSIRAQTHQNCLHGIPQKEVGIPKKEVFIFNVFL